MTHDEKKENKDNPLQKIISLISLAVGSSLFSYAIIEFVKNNFQLTLQNSLYGILGVVGFLIAGYGYIDKDLEL